MTQNALINELDKIYIIEFLSTKFECDKHYSEKDVNVIINRYHSFNDVPLLRRELISRQYLARKDYGSEYWKIK